MSLDPRVPGINLMLWFIRDLILATIAVLLFWRVMLWIG